jgi:hypothetical protein
MKILNWVLKYLEIQLMAIPFLPEGLQASAKVIMDQTALMGGSGEFKRAQALRGLMNRHPEARERSCALAIELEICSR